MAEKGNTRRQFIKGAAAAATAGLLGSLPGGSGTASAAPRSARGRGAGLRGGQPNFLVVMVDEERYPPGYESSELQAWRAANLPARNFLRSRGLEMHRHYTGSTACVPARNTFWTGHYPSLHGSAQTDGAAKTAHEMGMFWLDPNTVPTMGDYFRAAGYRTYYKGKWHVSETDILIPGTKLPLPSYTDDGTRDLALEQVYLDANRLDPFGFEGWIGPNPHGADPRNSGSVSANGPSGRDEAYASWTVDLLDELDAEGGEQPPWLVVSSFVNPHDIVLYGFFGALAPGYDFSIDPTVPAVPKSPTDDAVLTDKPICHASYRRTYRQAFQPTFNTETLRRLYYQLHKDVDTQILRVLQKLQATRFYEDTIVIFTSDHGELLGSHGGLFQKWHNAYDETIRVPFIVHNPLLFPSPRSEDMPTSHVDVLPTMLGLCGADPAALRAVLAVDHTDARPFVGRDLSALITDSGTPPGANEPVYFMTDDEPTKGTNQLNFTGFEYNSVLQPNHVETVIASVTTLSGTHLWKYSRYFDNPQFWSDPCNSDEVRPEIGDPSSCESRTKTQPVPEQYELYNLDADPYEATNLAHPSHQTPESQQARSALAALLEQQREQKRLVPALSDVAGCTVTRSVSSKLPASVGAGVATGLAALGAKKIAASLAASV
jgi:arylsulfatase A-like enzyme